MSQYQDSEDSLRTAVAALTASADDLLPTKWMPIREARYHVLLHLMVKADEHATEDVDLALMIAAAEDLACGFLIRAFSSYELRTRGVEHGSNSSLILHDPLPAIWWHRAVDKTDGLPGDSDGLPIHMVYWERGQIVRAQEVGHGESLAVVTNVEVDRQRLFELVKPVSQDDPAVALVRTTRGRKPDQPRIDAVRAAAKDVLKAQFSTLAEFYDRVIEKSGDPELSDKQVARWVFGDK